MWFCLTFEKSTRSTRFHVLTASSKVALSLPYSLAPGAYWRDSLQTVTSLKAYTRTFLTLSLSNARFRWVNSLSAHTRAAPPPHLRR